MNRINYQKVLDRELEAVKSREKIPRLALHVCCAPCSSYCLTYLTEYFDITSFYYNPNIFPEDEFKKRFHEEERFVNEMPKINQVNVVEGIWDNDRFNTAVKGMEDLPEGGERCFRCYEMRLDMTGKYAKENGYDYFTTTLSLSPYKDSQKLNEIGGKISEKYGIPYLYSDFKKKGGYQKSIEFSHEYGLYRQNFCGCVYSRRHDLISLGPKRQV